MRILNTIICSLLLFFISTFSYQKAEGETNWNKKYDFIYDIPPILFHYHHGVLAGSYPAGQETIEINFNDVSRFLGHVCLCGAGGYRISQIAVNLMEGIEKTLEKGEFTLISSNDHTISDVIAYILGCSRRNNPEKNKYFIDQSIKALRREYHYYIGYHTNKKAVHIIYRKHLLIGNEQMDKLWKIEVDYDKAPASVSLSDIELYQDAMLKIVKDVLLSQNKSLFEIKLIEYEDFLSRLNRLKIKQP
ncbi:hypothetical protein ISS30_08685 [bacterium]|nr:hypothetical protein [bacterium]